MEPCMTSVMTAIMPMKKKLRVRYRKFSMFCAARPKLSTLEPPNRIRKTGALSRAQQNASALGAQADPTCGAMSSCRDSVGSCFPFIQRKADSWRCHAAWNHICAAASCMTSATSSSTCR